MNMTPIDTLVQKADTLQRVQYTHGKFSVVQSYFYHLAKNPERIDSLLMWGVVTILIYLGLFICRRQMIQGLKGVNLLWEGGEQVTYFCIWAFFPVLFRVAFFKDSSATQVTALYIITGLIAYQVFGRYIFDWLLAFKGGLSSVPPVPPVQPAPTVTTTTEIKPTIP